MKPSVDEIIKTHRISPYNGSWYVQETKLREILEKVIEGVYNQGMIDQKGNDTHPNAYEPVTRHFKD